MRKTTNTGFLEFAICICCVKTGQTPENDCTKDVTDKRRIMKPWQKGAWETGKYRNVFLDAGYKKADIKAKLAIAYYDVFEGSNRVYFEVGDSMAYVSDLMNHDVRTEENNWSASVRMVKKDFLYLPELFKILRYC